MPTTRLLSLDAFRGLTMAAMILANNPGRNRTYAPLEHASWQGCTPTDLIFPFFLFIVGVAIPFSQAARQGRGDSRGTIAGGVITRSFSLVLLGLLLQSVPTRMASPLPAGYWWLQALQWTAIGFVGLGFVLLLWPWQRQRIAAIFVVVVAINFVGLAFWIDYANYLAAASLPEHFSFGTGLLDPNALRYPGILQRIGVCYLVAALLNLANRRWLLWLAAIAACTGYAVLMSNISFGGSIPGSYERTTNLAHMLDVCLFGPHNYKSYADPEGLLSTLPAVATAILGVLAGQMLHSEAPAIERCAKLLCAGVALAIVGVLLEWWVMPINKQLWTPSFVAFTAGLACLTLGAMFYVIDVRGRRAGAVPLVAMGMNAILVFLLSGVLARLLGLIHVPLTWLPLAAEKPPKATDVPLRSAVSAWVEHLQQLWTPASWHTPEAASLAYAIVFLGTLWLVCLVLYLPRWTIKV